MAYLLIAADDSGSQSNKGEIVRSKDTGFYGKMERLPWYLRVQVSGVTAAEVDEWSKSLKTFVSFTIVQENVQGWRARMEIDPVLIAATGIDATFKQAIKDYILNDPHEGNWTAIEYSQTPTSLTVDIAKGQPYGINEIKQDVSAWFKDRLEEGIKFQRYYFPDPIIDPRVAQGLIDEAAAEDGEGNIPKDFIHDTVTKAQALAAVVDRLE